MGCSEVQGAFGLLLEARVSDASGQHHARRVLPRSCLLYTIYEARNIPCIPFASQREWSNKHFDWYMWMCCWVSQCVIIKIMVDHFSPIKYSISASCTHVSAVLHALVAMTIKCSLHHHHYQQEMKMRLCQQPPTYASGRFQEAEREKSGTVFKKCDFYKHLISTCKISLTEDWS